MPKVCCFLDATDFLLHIFPAQHIPQRINGVLFVLTFALHDQIIGMVLLHNIKKVKFTSFKMLIPETVLYRYFYQIPFAGRLWSVPDAESPDDLPP